MPFINLDQECDRLRVHHVGCIRAETQMAVRAVVVTQADVPKLVEKAE